jgi:hypothetical protein
MLDTKTPLHRQISPTWRQIEAALQDYFGAVNKGHVVVEVGTGDLFFDWLDRCDNRKCRAVELNLSEIASHIANFIGDAA